MKNTLVFNSQEAYENWMEQFDSYADFESIPTVVDDGWKISADLMVECKSYKTALRRFEKAFKDVPDIAEFYECLADSCDSKCFFAKEGYMSEQQYGALSYGVEQIDENRWYIYVNLSGGYRGITR